MQATAFRHKSVTTITFSKQGTNRRGFSASPHIKEEQEQEQEQEQEEGEEERIRRRMT